MYEHSPAELVNCIRERTKLDTTGHDYHHALRVNKTGMYIAEKEGADLLVVNWATLLHDYCWDRENYTNRQEKHYGEEALLEIENLLTSFHFPEDKIKEILYCIEVHEDYTFSGAQKPETLEAMIVQDADRVDAMGPIGIARAFMFAGAHNIPMWIPGEEPGVFTFDNSYKSTITHFYEKLLKLKDNMNTETAKQIATKYHNFMEDFLQLFHEQWEGVNL